MQYPYQLYLAGSPGQVWGLVLGIIAFLVIMAGMLLALKWLQNRGLGGNTLSRRIRSLDRMMVGKETVLQLVQIGSRYLLISVGRDGARLITELSAEDLLPVAPGERSDPQNMPENVGFWKRFWHNLKVNMALSPKGTPYMTPAPAGEDSPDGETLSFDAVLRQAEKKEMQQSPISEQRSGHRHIESTRRSEPPKTPRKFNYQSSIDRMVQLSEPDRLDRRAGTIPSLSEYAAELESSVRPGGPESKAADGHTKETASKLENPIQSPITTMRKTQDKPANREKNIETLLDKIAERQSRYQNSKESDKP